MNLPGEITGPGYTKKTIEADPLKTMSADAINAKISLDGLRISSDNYNQSATLTDAINQANASSLNIVNENLKKLEGTFTEFNSEKYWDDATKAQINYNRSLAEARKVIDPFGYALEQLKTKWDALINDAEKLGQDTMPLVSAKTQEINDLFDKQSASVSNVVSDYDDLIDDTNKLFGNKELPKKWFDVVNEGLANIDNGFNIASNTVSAFFDILYQKPELGNIYGIADDLESIKKQITDTTMQNTKDLETAQKNYDDTITEAEKARQNALNQAKDDYNKSLHSTLTEQLIAGQTLREAQQKTNKEYQDAIEKADQQYANTKTQLNDQMTGKTKDQKDAELQIIKDFQKSQLSEMDRQKIDINDNYKALEQLYKEYSYDTVGLEKDRQKALRDLEVQGFKDSLDKLSGYVNNVKDILGGLKSAWNVAIDLYKKFIQTTSQTPLSDLQSEYVVGGGGIGVPETSNAEPGKGETNWGAVASGIGIYYEIYQGYKGIKASQKEFKETEKQVNDLYKQGRISLQEAISMMLNYEKSTGNERGAKIYENILSSMPKNTEITSGASSTTTASANQAPSQSLTINLAPNRNMMTDMVDEIELIARKKGYRVSKQGYA
jgi:hypothetical protein